MWKGPALRRRHQAIRLVVPVFFIDGDVVQEPDESRRELETSVRPHDRVPLSPRMLITLLLCQIL